jgi:tetratricopeptide (TPR) repeat protein
MTRQKDARLMKVKTDRAGISPLLVFFWLLAAALAAYYNSFRNAFQLDDFHITVNNPWIHSLRHIPRFFVDPFTFSTVKSNADYRPLLSATYALNYAISRTNPWSWHALSLLLHITVAMSLFWLGRTLFGRGRLASIPWLNEEEGEFISFGAAVLFAVHPIGTAAVNYMSARSSLLVTALVLPATVLYLRAIRSRRGVGGIVLPLFLYGLALLSKVEAVSLLGVLYIAELLLSPAQQKNSKNQLDGEEKGTKGRPIRRLTQWLLPTATGWWRFLPFALLTAIYIGFRLIILPPGLNYAWGVPVFSHSTYLLTQFRAWWYYVGQVVAPVQMVADYGAYPVSTSLFDPRVLYALAGWALVGTLLWYAIRRAPAVAFLGLAYFIHLSPHSSFMPISEMVNEHRPYLPVTGLFLLGGLGIFLLVKALADRSQIVFGAIIIILALPLGALTYDRNKVWRDEMSFWSDIVRKDPEAPRAQMNYGLVLMARGDYPEAEYRFRESGRLSPSYNAAHINLGIVLAAQGYNDEARSEYDLAVRLLPNDPSGYYWRGLFLTKQGDLNGAIADLQKAASLATVPGKELEALADNLIRAGRMQEAREAIERGSAVDPGMFNALRQKLK